METYKLEQKARLKAYNELLPSFKKTMDGKRANCWNEAKENTSETRASFLRGILYHAEEAYYELKGRIEYLTQELKDEEII